LLLIFYFDCGINSAHGSGNVYALVAPMNEAQGLQFFSSNVLGLFANGFPDGWHEILFHHVQSIRTASPAIDRPPYNAAIAAAAALEFGFHTE
jgi:hypothetical protein